MQGKEDRLANRVVHGQSEPSSRGLSEREQLELLVPAFREARVTVGLLRQRVAELETELEDERRRAEEQLVLVEAIQQLEEEVAEPAAQLLSRRRKKPTKSVNFKKLCVRFSSINRFKRFYYWDTGPHYAIVSNSASSDKSSEYNMLSSSISSYSLKFDINFKNARNGSASCDNVFFLKMYSIRRENTSRLVEPVRGISR